MKDKKLIPKRPAFTQENFLKMFNELDKLHEFLLKYLKMPIWKRMLFGKFIIKKYLKGSK